MKKNFLLIFFSILLLPCMFVLSGCINIFNPIDRYLSVVPSDREFEATLLYTNETNIGSSTMDWYVARTTKAVAGQNREIIYMEYKFTDNDDDYSYEETFLYVESTVLFLKDGTWKKYDTSSDRPYDTWGRIYGSASQPSSFVYELTQPINYRDFPQRKKTNTTSEYIEYTFDDGGEVMRISNNMYHVLLYYKFDYVKSATNFSHVRKEANFSFSAPSKVIDTSSITQDMLEN